MITNAIPGINNLNDLFNATQSKGIVATKEQTASFQRALSNANTQKQTASISLSVSKTLTTTGAATDNNPAAVYDRTQNVRNADDGAVKQLSSDNNSQADDKATVKASENNANTVDASAENAATAQVTEETNEAAEVLVMVNDNPDGEALVAEISEDALSELEQALLDSSRDLMQQLADAMGVDLEDIENAMATLGLTNVAILDPTNMTSIVAQITGADDVMAIVTNADVYLNIQNMQDAVDTTRHNLMEEFNLSEEGLSSALENFNEELEQRAQESHMLPEETPVIVEHAAENVQPSFSSEAARIDLYSEGTIKEVSEPAEAPEVVPEDAKFKIEINVEEQLKDSKQDNEPKQDTPDGSQYNHIMNQISSSLSEVVEPESYGQMARTNTQDIMDQIIEFIKMNVKPESTTMELQLHPASLGNVNVIIEAAKDGNIVAKFLTQNEDVKAAIESQLQQLQEKFNEQGVKVTAVEVAVNAGAFDQTLNDSQSQKEDDQDAQDSIRKPMRRIRLEDISMEEIDEIDEKDQLTAEMMAINGNSVDFSA